MRKQIKNERKKKQLIENDILKSTKILNNEFGKIKNKCVSVTGLNFLGRIGTHIFFIYFVLEKYNFMHFERQFAFQNA